MNQLIIHLMSADNCSLCGGQGEMQVRRMTTWPPLRSHVPCPLCQRPDELVAFLNTEAGAA